MKINLLKTIISLTVFFIVTAGTATAATYKVQIDCNHNSMRNTDTGNRITVSFLDRNRNLIRSVSKNGVRNCAQTDSVFTIVTNREVRFITFRTNGSDAFYIDEWRLYKNGVRIHWQGRDNGKGWCLSTDSGDSAGSWRNFVTGSCRSAIRFPVTGGATGSNLYKVQIDCYHNSVRNTDTGNRITVSFLDGNGRIIGNVSKNGVRNCARTDSVFSLNTNREVKSIVFRTNGNDAFYIDEWRLYKNGARVHWQGRDNGKGWCLSTDSGDSSGSWRNFVTGSCRSNLRFPVTAVSGGSNTYKVQVDCYHNAIRNTDTGNRITVSFLDGNRNLIRNVSKNGVRNCAQTDSVFSIVTNRKVQYIAFSTNGNDAFYIDEWRLFRGNQRIKWESRDNGKGWCISTDPNDAAGWRNYLYGSCKNRIVFPLTSTGNQFSKRVIVNAKTNSSTGGVGKDTGINLQRGQRLIIRTDPNQKWRAGAGWRISNANGIRTIGKFTKSGLSAHYGSLVGRIGSGRYFFVGTNFSGTANSSGRLYLFYWDSNKADNSGSISVNISTAGSIR